MVEMVQARRTGVQAKEERHDLFNSLLDANDAEAEEGARLSDSALMGACYCGRLVCPRPPDRH